jgi:hypothetical protein
MSYTFLEWVLDYHFRSIGPAGSSHRKRGSE